MTKPLTYADAGVDIDKANNLVNKIKEIVKNTPQKGVRSDIGGFGGLFSPNLNDINKPMLVGATDGVGTKLKIAFMMDKHDTIGIDLVAMCVNDIAVLGAKPLFFLDYLSIGKLNIETAASIIEGVAEGCRQADCALLGGETAEMPGLYKDGEYDLAGFSVGLVDDNKIIDNSNIKKGHKLIGIPSSGLHSNGYSLVRKICFDVLNLKIDSHVPELGKTIGEELLTPTLIYTKMINQIIRNITVNGIVHITGGGFEDNIVRIIPASLKVQIEKKSWEKPPVFNFLQDAGKISDEEMYRTFNNGIGMILIAPEDSAQDIVDLNTAQGKKAMIIGDVCPRKNSEASVEWV